MSHSGASAQSAAVPQLINYQGKLTDGAGDPLPTREYVLSFSIYDAPGSGATLVWGPQVFDGSAGVGRGAQVPVVKGFFNVILGPSDTDGRAIANAFDSPNRFLEIRVGDSGPVLPRQQILSTAYAFRAERASAIDSNTVGTSDIRDSTIKREDLDASLRDSLSAIEADLETMWVTKQFVASNGDGTRLQGLTTTERFRACALVYVEPYSGSCSVGRADSIDAEGYARWVVRAGFGATTDCGMICFGEKHE